MCLFGEWLSQKALQSVCKIFPPPPAPPSFPHRLINEPAFVLSAPIYQVRGYRASCMGGWRGAWFIRDFNSSVGLLTEHEGMKKRKKKRRRKAAFWTRWRGSVAADTASAAFTALKRDAVAHLQGPSGKMIFGRRRKTPPLRVPVSPLLFKNLLFSFVSPRSRRFVLCFFFLPLTSLFSFLLRRWAWSSFFIRPSVFFAPVKL